MKNIEYLHTRLKEELDLTQHYIDTFSYTGDKLANISIRHIVGNRGKMLRPILLILAGRYSFQASGESTENEKSFLDDLAKAAAILELVQMSSLIHDDVLDQSSKRRNQSTLHTLRGNRFAILMGDYLVAQSLKNCWSLIQQATRIFDSVVLYAYLDGISRLVLGEIQQNNYDQETAGGKSNLDLYYEIIDNKTASLFSLACFVGATIGSSDKNNSAMLKSFGHNIGMAYQIIDDLRDFSMNSKIAGEKNFQDVKYGIRTLPMILAAGRCSNGEMAPLERKFNCKKELSPREKKEIIELLDRTGGIEGSAEAAEKYLSAAREIAAGLDRNPFSELLTDFTTYLTEVRNQVVDGFLQIKPN